VARTAAVLAHGRPTSTPSRALQTSGLLTHRVELRTASRPNPDWHFAAHSDFGPIHSNRLGPITFKKRLLRGEDEESGD